MQLVPLRLVRYSSFESKEMGKKKSNGQFEIKAVKWDAATGGEDMDMLLIDHFGKEFDAKHKPAVSVADAPKAIGKLRKQVRKTKEILSANKEAPLSVEGMHEDVDFRATIKRDTFEEMLTAVGFFDRAVAPLKGIIDMLPDFNLTLEDIHVVEVIGGATRVPGIKTALVAAMDGRPLDVHLDADEAVAMGAGLFAANMSTTFRMRKFGAADAAPYSFKVDLNQEDKPEHKMLLPLYKRFPVRRIVSIPNATENVFFTVYHNTTAGPLPPGIVAEKVADFNITGVPEAAEKYNVTGKINAHFAVDNSGIMYMEKAEYQVEVIDWVEVKEKAPKVKAAPKTPPKTNKTTIPTDQNATEAEAEGAEKTTAEGAEETTAEDAEKPAATEEEGAEKPASRRLLEDDAAADSEEVPADITADPDAPLPDDAPIPDDAPVPDADAADVDGNATDGGNATATPKEPKMRQRRRVFKIPLNVAETGRAVAPMTSDNIGISIGVLKTLAKKDEEKRRQEAAKSNLEAYIYSIREKIAEDEDIQKVTDEEQREKFSAELTDAEDWLYMDGADSSAAEFDAKKDVLEAVGAEWVTRAKELERRPEAVARAKDFVDLAKKTVEMFNETKPWITEEEKAKLLADVDGFAQWLDEKVATQEGKKPTEVPVFTAAEVTVELRPLEGKLAKLKKKAAPKPPPPPPSANKTDANATATDANATATDDAADPEVEADVTADAAAEGEAAAAGEEEKPAEGEAAKEEEGAGAEGEEEKDHTELRH
jgi:hypoxia up-regulated 1